MRFSNRRAPALIIKFPKMADKKFKIKNLIFLSVAAAVLFLAPARFAKAGTGDWLTGEIGKNIFTGFTSMLFDLIGNGIAILAKLLNFVLHMAIYSDSVNAPVVYQSWTIMRDFANMFFIIALIVMAFATIFDIAKYSAKALIGKFLIAALLINFSLTLGGLVIDGAQILNNTFLTAIGDSAIRLGQTINPAKLMPGGESEIAGALATANLPLNLIMGLILFGVFFVSMLIATIFALIRIPMVWFLLIVSPLAWIAGVFPQGDGYFKNWWKQFIGWNLFLPVFLFFLYFGLYFMTNIGGVIGKISQGYAETNLGLINATFQDIFTYVLAAIFLIGGVIMAFKVSFLSGTSAIKAAGWAKGTTMNTLGRYTGIAAMGKAAQMKREQIQKEGLPGRFGQKLYGGEAGQERRTAVWAERFGVMGAGEQQLAKDIGANKKRFANITDAVQLRGLMNGGSKSEQLAIREIMKEKNLLSGQELIETHELYGGNKSLAGKQFARSIDFDKLSTIERASWLNKTEDIETKQKIATIMADKGELKDVDAIKKAAGLFTLEGQKKDLINKTKKGNLMFANQTLLELGLLKDEKGQTMVNNETNINKALENDIAKMTPDMLLESTKSFAKDPEVQKIVEKTLTPQKIKAMVEKATPEQLATWEPIMATRKTEFESKDAEKEAAKSAILADAIVKALRTAHSSSGDTPPTTP